MTTQIIEAKKGNITEEMKYIALKEGVTPEFVREKVMELTHDEIPHTVTCYVENYEEEENLVNIQVLIVVDRDNLKKIIIGKNGLMLKEIGSRARIDMEKFLGISQINRLLIPLQNTSNQILIF